MPYLQYLEEIRFESAISQRLWIKVIGMLQQNWCVTEPARDGGVDMLFFDDHGDVFDWRSAPDLAAAQTALCANGFNWMSTYSSFFNTAGMPTLPAPGARERSRPIYSSGKYWDEPSGFDRFPPERTDMPMTASRDALHRFVDAQNPVWYPVVEELACGRKRSHWMWFVFPQLRSLGSSRMADYFGLSSSREAAAYWDDDVLGSRLRSCVNLLLELSDGTTARGVFGKIDAMKLRSSMTIFENAGYADESVVAVLDRYFQGRRCPLTLEIIKTSEPARRMRFSR
jgi:uncharacterized protein (DUF1810 family)